MATIVENELFSVNKRQYNSREFYHIVLHPLKKTSQVNVDVLTQILRTICENDTCKTNVILDCSDLKCLKTISTFRKLDLKQMIGVANTGLSKFIIVSSSELIKAFATPIIASKNAQSYTFVSKDLQEALSQL